MRLLNRTVINYLIYTIVVAVVSIPLFYGVINKLFIDDVDETLMLRKQEVQFRTKSIKSDEDIRLWERLDGDIQLNRDSAIRADSMYSITHFDSLADEKEPYRVLSSSILIHGRPYHLLLRQSLVESKDLIKAIVSAQVVLLVILLSGLMIINGIISNHISNPFSNTLHKLKH